MFGPADGLGYDPFRGWCGRCGRTSKAWGIRRNEDGTLSGKCADCGADISVVIS